jgi:hypothetical protein
MCDRAPLRSYIYSLIHLFTNSWLVLRTNPCPCNSRSWRSARTPHVYSGVHVTAHCTVTWPLQTFFPAMFSRTDTEAAYYTFYFLVLLISPLCSSCIFIFCPIFLFHSASSIFSFPFVSGLLHFRIPFPLYPCKIPNATVKLNVCSNTSARA